MNAQDGPPAQASPADPAPLFSIVTPIYAPPLDVLTSTIESVLAQELADWELILVDDASPDPAVRELLRSYAARDRRIRVVERATNGHIVAASNDGIDAARGDFVVLLDHDDLLTPDALARNAQEIAADEEVDYLYSDEDKVGGDGSLYDEFRKPTWSPERLRGQNYCCHLSVARTSLVREVGGFREGFDGSQDHDLVLRLGERARRVVHIPEVLYHWRVVPGSAAGAVDAKPYAHDAGRRAVQEHVGRTGIGAAVVDGPVPGVYELERRIPAQTAVSFVIPTMGKEDLIWGARRVLVVDAVRSLLARAGHDNVEVVVVFDTPTPKDVLDRLLDVAGDRLTLVPFDEEFNYSRKMNLGAAHSSGEHLVLLNDDLEAITDGWVPRLVGPLLEPGVGMTGAKLLFGDRTIQHAGHAYAAGHYRHPWAGVPASWEGPFRALLVNREVSGVTAACAAISRSTFFAAGGFSERLPLNFNDVDLSYKVQRHLGLRILYVANVEMFHFESRSRSRRVEPFEQELLVERWGTPGRDPYVPVE
jgi:glycosyltransferase involved in cell wall biosynthesis